MLITATSLNQILWLEIRLYCSPATTRLFLLPFPRSFSLGTAQSYDDSTENIIALSGEDVILPTAVVFENAGHCGVNPEYTQARLRYEPDQIVLFHCMKMPCLENSATHSYNFSALGNVTLHPPVNPGPYFMALIQMCPSPVLRMTYNVNVVGKTNIRRYNYTALICGYGEYHSLELFQLARFELGQAGIAIGGIWSLRGNVAVYKG